MRLEDMLYEKTPVRAGTSCRGLALGLIALGDYLSSHLQMICTVIPAMTETIKEIRRFSMVYVPPFRC